MSLCFFYPSLLLSKILDVFITVNFLFREDLPVSENLLSLVHNIFSSQEYSVHLVPYACIELSGIGTISLRRWENRLITEFFSESQTGLESVLS